MVKDMQTIMNFCKSRGFMYQGSEIYGGIANVWDFGPLGCRLKNNIKDTWRKRYIQERTNSYEIDAAILMHPKSFNISPNTFPVLFFARIQVADARRLNTLGAFSLFD